MRIVRKLRYSDHIVGRERAQRWLEQVRAALGPYRRERPRDPEKARLLRERGTPEHLIGPEK
jgi:hypothetical protein